MFENFFPSLTLRQNKLVHLSLTSPSSLLEYLQVRPRAYPIGEHMKGVPFERAPYLLANNRQG
jgi:hypothetical protein